MKERIGFVSNSSSSSFVAVGVKLDDSFDIDKKKILKEVFRSEKDLDAMDEYALDDAFFEAEYDSEYLIDEEGYEGTIMKIIADAGSDGDDWSEEELDFSDLQSMGEDIIKTFCLPVDSKIKLFVGTRCC